MPHKNNYSLSTRAIITTIHKRIGLEPWSLTKLPCDPSQFTRVRQRRKRNLMYRRQKIRFPTTLVLEFSDLHTYVKLREDILSGIRESVKNSIERKILDYDKYILLKKGSFDVYLARFFYWTAWMMAFKMVYQQEASYSTLVNDHIVPVYVLRLASHYRLYLPSVIVIRALPGHRVPCDLLFPRLISNYSRLFKPQC